MGLFGRKKTSPEEEQAKAVNRERLESFNVTKAWGVKKYGPAMQFIYDGDARQFVVVEGPEDTFRERNPFIVDFDMVKDVILEVEEDWQKGPGEFEPKGFGQLLQEDYKKVYWRYEFWLTIRTDHPYAGDIRYRMNFKPTITKVPQHGLMFRRGFGIGGRYRGAEIGKLAGRLEEMTGKEAKAKKLETAAEILTLNRKEGIVEGTIDLMKDDIFLKKIDNMAAHVKRADRISRLLLG